MSFKEKFILYSKNPIAWLILIVIIVLPIIVYFLLKTTPTGPSNKCDPPKISHLCVDKLVCGDQCSPEFEWDCNSKKCLCKKGTTICNKGTTCCEACVNDICCSVDQQITNPDGTIGCCNPGTKPSTDKKSCSAVCGSDNKSCGNGQDCTKVTNLIKSSYDDMISKYSGESDWRGGVWDSKTNLGSVSFCTNPNKCSFGDQSGLPWGDITKGAYTYYDFSGTGGDDGDELCFPKDPTDTICYTQTKNECGNNNNKCQWLNILDEYAKSDPSVNIETKMQEWLAYKGQSYNGFYCGDDSQPFARFEKVTGDGDCSWQDCVNHITNKGTTRVNWDASNLTCTSLKGGTKNGGIQGNILCTGYGVPCSSCQKAGDYVDCVKCTGNGTPCPECKSGQYIPTSSCLSNNWEFKKCNPVINGIDTSVLKYSCDGGDCKSCGDGKYCGNCPWGGNDSNNSSDYSNNDPPLKHGEPNETDSLACYSDNQIRQWKPFYYRVDAPLSGNACTDVSDPRCKHPGKAICVASKNPCAQGEIGCYTTSESCEQENTCDESHGWTKNTDKTDCNIFKCTTDGNFLDRNAPAGTRGLKNADKLFDYGIVKGYEDGICFRRGPPDNPSDNKYCSYNAGSASCDRTDPAIPADLNWTDWYCRYKFGTGCTAQLTDTVPVFNKQVGGPNYFYFNNNGNKNYCYTDSSRPYGDATVDFTVDGTPQPSENLSSMCV